MPPNASEPASGSVIAHAAIFSSVISSGSQRSFCASVPRLMMVAAPSPRLTPTVLSRPMLTPASSETIATAIDACAPISPSPPPCFVGELLGRRTSALARSFSSMPLTASAAITSRPNSLNSFRAIGYGDSSPLSKLVQVRPDLLVDERAHGVAHDDVGIGPFEHRAQLRQPCGDVVDLPDAIGLDGLGVVPAAQAAEIAPP